MISKEEKLIIKTLFSKDKCSEDDFKNIDYENLIKITSSHLVLPTFYYELRKKNYLHKLPNDLVDYMQKIYELNFERNKNLVYEIIEISKFLKSQKLNPIFLKGSAHILNNIYDDIGVRMIGDIDILSNYEEAEKIFLYLKEFGYVPISKFNFFKTVKKHHPRQINKEKIFAIEVHKPKLLKKNIKNFSGENLLKNVIKNNGKKTPDPLTSLHYNILNYQINDYGNIYLKYSFRSIYDSLKIMRQNQIKYEDLKIDKYISNYFLILDELKINYPKKSIIKKNLISLYRFRLINSLSLYKKVEKTLIKICIQLNKLPLQTKEFINNKNYRINVLKRITSF